METILPHIVWPLTLIVITVFFSVFFRNAITSAISRIKNINKSGVNLGDIPAPEQPKAPADFQKTLDTFSRSRFKLEIEAEILKELTTKEIKNPDEQIKFLVRALSETALNLRFSKISNAIYGSQLQLLIQLNTMRNGVHVDEANKIYNAMMRANKRSLDDFPFDKWLGFLVDQKLVQLNTNLLLISEMGIEFLEYLVRSGETNVRPN